MGAFAGARHILRHDAVPPTARPATAWTSRIYGGSFRRSWYEGKRYALPHSRVSDQQIPKLKPIKQTTNMAVFLDVVDFLRTTPACAAVPTARCQIRPGCCSIGSAPALVGVAGLDLDGTAFRPAGSQTSTDRAHVLPPGIVIGDRLAARCGRVRPPRERIRRASPSRRRRIRRRCLACKERLVRRGRKAWTRQVGRTERR